MTTTDNPMDLISTSEILAELEARHDLVVVLTHRERIKGRPEFDEFAVHYASKITDALDALRTAQWSLEKEQERMLHSNNEGDDDGGFDPYEDWSPDQDEGDQGEGGGDEDRPTP